MSKPSTENVLSQLLHLGLDAQRLGGQGVQVEIDSFDHWANPAGLSVALTTPCTCGVTAPMAELSA